MKAANRVVKNTMFLYAKMLITVFASLYSTRLVLEALGVSDYGIFTLIAGIMSLMNFINGAMSTATQRFMSVSKGKGDLKEELNVFNIGIVIHTVVGILLAVLMLVFAPYLFDNVLAIDPGRLDTAKLIFDFMIVSMLFSVISVPYDAVINANEDLLFIAILGVVESFLKLAAAIVITVYIGDKLTIYGLLIALISFFSMCTKMVYSHRKYVEVVVSVKKYFSRQKFHEMVSFVSYNFLGVSTEMIANYGQSVVINMFFGTAVNAAQGIVNQISGQLNAFANTMLRALNPMLIKSEGAGDRKLMLDTTFSGIKFSFFLIILFYVPVLLEMDVLFNLWLVDVPMYTIVFGKLLLLRNLIQQLYQTLVYSIFAVGNIKKFQIINALWNFFPLPTSYVLFKYGFQPYAIYLIFIVYTIFQGGIYIWFSKKICGMSIRAYIYKVIFKSVLPFIIIFGIVSIPHFIIDDDVVRLFIVAILNVFVFAGTVWKIGLTGIEKNYILKALKKLKSKKRSEEYN